MEQQPLLDLAKRYTAAWCSGDPASVAAHYSPQGSLTINDGAACVGRAAIAEAAAAFMTAFPDMQVIMDGLLNESGHTVYHWTLTGINTGPGGTGRSIRISGFEEWKLGGDGLIFESRGHFDYANYSRQLSESG